LAGDPHRPDWRDWREAVAAYRTALEEWTPEKVPLEWAMTQNNLGTALLRLGERESGAARLEQAVAAFREALEKRTRDRVPLEWAMTQNNLDTALLRLGERKSGTAQLEEAVAAYHAALEEHTRERGPLDWAATQMNLGKALQAPGRAGKRQGATGAGCGGLSRRAPGIHTRSGSIRLGVDAEQPWHGALQAWLVDRIKRFEPSTSRKTP
jgi:tetratricopeptide (TPR) repeat protein